MSKGKVLIFLVIIIVIGVVGYLGFNQYNKNISVPDNSNKTEIQTNDNNIPKYETAYTNTSDEYNNSDKFAGMEGIGDGSCFKKISTFEEYQEELNRWNGLFKMTEEDFKDNYMVVVSGENYHTTSLEVDNITTDDTTTYIDLKQTDKYIEDHTVLSVKLSREYERERLVVRNNPVKPSAPSSMTKIEDIPAGYSIEEAIADGCLVIKDHKENNGREVLSDNINAMDEFVEKCNNGEDAFIRIYEYNIIDNADIIDVEAKKGKITICDKNVTQEGAVVGAYKSGYKIDIYESENHKSYTLVDEIGNKRPICSIDFN